MKSFSTPFPTKNFLIIDIETVAGNATLDSLSERMQALWKKKSMLLKNPEEKSAIELYESSAGIYAEFGKVVVIAVGLFYIEDNRQCLRIKSFASHDELDLLSTFVEFVNSKFDPKMLTLCAHNGIEFDFPYLARRMLVHGIDPTYALDMRGKKPWEVPHIDTMELWKFGDRKSYTSLDLLTALFNIPSSKDALDGSKVSSTYYKEPEGLSRIETYCRADVLVTAQLYLRLHNMALISEDAITIVE